MDTQAHITTLADEIVAVLQVDQGWLGAHALLQRCALAKDGDELGSVLTGLVAEGALQRHADRLGPVYAATGVPHPEHRVDTARGPGGGPQREAGTHQAAAEPRPCGEVMAIRQASLRAKLEAVRQTLVNLFQAQPVRSCRELQAALGKSQPVVSGYLRAMREEGLIEQRGSGAKVHFVWQGETLPRAAAAAPTAPAACEQAPHLAAAVHAEPQRDHAPAALTQDADSVLACDAASASPGDADAAFGLRSDGGLEMRLLGRQWVFKGGVAQQLIDCVNAGFKRDSSGDALMVLWSNGAFEVRAQGEQIVIPPAEFLHLCAFLSARAAS